MISDYMREGDERLVKFESELKRALANEQLRCEGRANEIKENEDD